MARMWKEGVRFLPNCDEFYYVDANWHFPVLAVMHGVNFVWYNVRDNVTCACVKIIVGSSYSEKTIERQGFIKPEDMTVGSQWEKRVCIIFYRYHFMHIKEFLGAGV